MLSVRLFLFSYSSQVVISKISATLVLQKVCQEGLIQIDKAVYLFVSLKNLVRKLARLITFFAMTCCVEILAWKV